MKKSRDEDTRESREPLNEFKDLLASCVLFIHIFAFAIFTALFSDSDRSFVSRVVGS